MVGSNSALNAVLPVFWFSTITGIFPLKLQLGNTFKCIESKILLYYSNFLISYLILHDVIFYYGPFFKTISENLSSTGNVLVILLNFFFNGYLIFIFFFIFRSHSNFLHVFKQLHMCNNILPIQKSPRNKILFIFVLYQIVPLITFIIRCNFFYNITFLSLNDSAIPYLMKSLLSYNFSVFLIYYFFYLKKLILQLKTC
jgi:hypothetical protein